jgi:Uma2 family endonuclease
MALSRYVHKNQYRNITTLTNIFDEAYQNIREHIMNSKKLKTGDFDFLPALNTVANKYDYKLELIDGRLRLFGTATPFHNKMILQLGIVLDQLNKEWEFLPRQDVQYGDKVWNHDMVGWKKSNWILNPYQTTTAIKTRPDWVCEVLSPNTRHIDLKQKQYVERDGNKYDTLEKHKVPYYWTIDSLQNVINRYKLDGNNFKLMEKIQKENGLEVSKPFGMINFDRIYNLLNIDKTKYKS